MHLLHNMTLAQAGCPTMAVRFLEPYADLDCCLKLNFTAAVSVPTCLLVEVRVYCSIQLPTYGLLAALHCTDCSRTLLAY